MTHMIVIHMGVESTHSIAQINTVFRLKNACHIDMILLKIQQKLFQNKTDATLGNVMSSNKAQLYFKVT